MSYKKSSKKTLEAMKILGFPVSKNFNDLDIKDIQRAYKTKIQNEPKVAAYDPLCPQTHPPDEDTRPDAVIFGAYKYLVTKFLSEKVHLEHSEGCQNCAAHKKKLPSVVCNGDHPESTQPVINIIQNIQADEDDRIAALDLANLLVSKQGLELSACHIIKRALGNSHRDEESEIEKMLSSVKTSRKSSGDIEIDRIISAKFLLNRQGWSHGPRRPSSKVPQRRMSTSAVREPGYIDCKETLESTLEQLKLLNLTQVSESDDPISEKLGSAALTQRRQSMPGNIKLNSTKTLNSKKQDILTIVEENEQNSSSKGSLNKISK